MTIRPPLSSTGIGTAAALGAFLLWGFSPLYYRAVGQAGALEILAHRVVWSLLLCLLLVVASGRVMELRRLLGHGRHRRILLVSALLVSVNWLGFIWAVNNDRALEASMGYFIFPIMMLLLGRLFLDERLNRPQQLAVGLVLGGVAIQLLLTGRLPWIALVLAVSFSLYGLVRKKIPVGTLVGLTMECLLLAPPALLYLGLQWRDGALVFGTLGPGFDALLAAAALVTAIPLLLFTSATRRLRLGTVGLLQYLNPTCQFLLAVFLFREPFGQAHLASFLLIWSGVLLFTLDSRRRAGQAAQG